LSKRLKLGFLLIEILVAMGVVAITFAALLHVFSRAWKASLTTQHTQLACLLAEQKIWDTLWAPQLSIGTTQGKFKNHPEYFWTQDVSLLYSPPEEETQKEEEEARPRARTLESLTAREKLPPTDLYQVVVRVNWEEQNKQREFKLSTFTLVPTPEEEDWEEAETEAQDES